MDAEIFSRQRRRLNRARALRADRESRWLAQRTVEELIDRLSFMTVDLKHVLIFGDGYEALRAALPSDCCIVRADIVANDGVEIVIDEDRLPSGTGGFDLVFATGTLESIHDLPGALILLRRALRPGGLFMGAMVGGGSFSAFRHRVQTTEQKTADGGAARFHPQVDVRSVGDLLFRAGFSTPVADMETTTVHYTSVGKILADIRGMGFGNALPQVQRMNAAAGREVLTSGEIDEQIFTIYLTGWSPVADEIRPSGPVKGFG
jgi:SAM-dependent methyltransferase